MHVESLCRSTGSLAVRGNTKGTNISWCEVGPFILGAGEWPRDELYSCCRMNGVEAGGHKVDTIVSRDTCLDSEKRPSLVGLRHASAVIIKREGCKEPEDRYAPSDASSALSNVCNRTQRQPSSGLQDHNTPVACLVKDQIYVARRETSSWHRAPRGAETVPTMSCTLSTATNTLF